MTKWEYMELKITHDEVELIDGELQATSERKSDPYEYVKRMIADGWELVTRSGILDSEFSVVLRRPIPEE